MTFTGELVAQAEGYFGGDSVAVLEGGFETDPIKTVGSGADDIGVAGAERVLKAVTEGADLVVIAEINPRSPAVFLVRDTSAIHSPGDFRGQLVGVLTGSHTEIAYEAMIAAAGLPRSEMRELEIGYDLPAFAQGRFGVLPAFRYDEPLSLARQGVGFRILDPGDYGVQLIGNVYFTRRDFADAHPEVVQAFLSGVLRGWQFAFDRPEDAINILLARDASLDRAKELQSLRIAEAYFRPDGRQLLTIQRNAWDSEVATLRRLHYLTGPVDLDAVLRPEFLGRAGGTRP
jgi:NitT/TauT family transport system substrate-binding protein